MDDQVKREQLKSALAEFCEGLQMDGADIDVLSFDGSTARTRLLFGPKTCLECILPKDVLEQIMLATLQESMPEVSRVELDDPRLG